MFLRAKDNLIILIRKIKHMRFAIAFAASTVSTASAFWNLWETKTYAYCNVDPASFLSDSADTCMGNIKFW